MSSRVHRGQPAHTLLSLCPACWGTDIIDGESLATQGPSRLLLRASPIESIELQLWFMISEWDPPSYCRYQYSPILFRDLGRRCLLSNLSRTLLEAQKAVKEAAVTRAVLSL